MRRGIAGLAAALLLVAGCAGGKNGSNAVRAGDTIKIGVLLHLSGGEQRDWRKPLEWAVENVNKAGGIAGKRLELVYRDIAGGKLDTAAVELARDPGIVAVVGPQKSSEVFRVAKTVIDSQTVVVTPSATSADLYRAFSRFPFFWRTVESDIAQTRVLLGLAARGGATKVALLTSTDQYGTSFFDWFGFFADELGLQTTAVERWDQTGESCQRPLDAALRGHPDALIAVPSSAPVLECIVRRFRQVGQGTRLLLPDTGERPVSVKALGSVAEGMEGTAPAPTPGDGFAQAFRRRFHDDPSPYAANAYDAVTLIAYGLQRSHGKGKLALAEAMRHVTGGRGAKTGWNEQGIAAALASIRKGGTPDVTGAAGPFAFDDESYTDPVESTYRHWIVRGGRLVTLGTLTTGDTKTAGAEQSIYRSLASGRLRSRHARVGGSYDPGKRRTTWALLVAGSSGWENYRHQADVLAQYRLLHANGVPDSRIVLISANDIANAPENPAKGVVRYQPGGPNLYRGVKVDYPLHGLTATDLLQILAGHSSPRHRAVIRSGPGDDVYVFLAGHGNRRGFYVGLNGQIPERGGHYSVLTPSAVARTVRDLQRRHRYRRLLIAVEACEGGTLGTKLDAPGAALIAGASPTEDSESTNYDAKLGTWLADEFASSFWHVASNHPDWTLGKVYETTYLHVHGSHVSLYAPAFGSLRHVPLSEFLRP